MKGFAMQNWQWPGRARAAVSLTYDDGNENNLDQAIPDLEAAGLCGTFYLPVGRDVVIARKGDWRAAHQRGHEIGSHTVTHPCRRDAYPPGRGDWIRNPLEKYTPDMILREVRDAAAWLDENVGHDPDRTFAYPCGAVAIGLPPEETCYNQIVGQHHFAARVGGDMSNDPRRTNLLRITSFAAVGPTRERLRSWCEGARTNGHWAVIMFHGIGGPSHTTDRDVHRGFIEYLNSEPYWVAPIRQVGRYIERFAAAARS